MTILENKIEEAKMFIKNNYSRETIKNDKIESTALELICTCILSNNPNFNECMKYVCIGNEEKIDSTWEKENDMYFVQTKKSSRSSDDIDLFLKFINTYIVSKNDLPAKINDNIISIQQSYKDHIQNHKKINIKAFFALLQKKKKMVE